MSGHNAEPACDAMPEYLQAYRVALERHVIPRGVPLYDLARGPVAALEGVANMARAMVLLAGADVELVAELSKLTDEAARVWWRAYRIKQRIRGGVQ